MFEVDVKNVTEEEGRGGGDQLGFWVLNLDMDILLDMYCILIVIGCVSDMTEVTIPIPTYRLDPEPGGPSTQSVTTLPGSVECCVVCSV